jgi:outer membrane lipoprotein-sorting protein
MNLLLTRRAVLASLASLPVLAHERRVFADTDEVLTGVAKARASLKTLTAPFEQVRVIGLLAEPVKSKGELTLVRPDQLRWELFAPDDVVYWVSKDGVAYRPGKGQKPARVPKKGGFTAVLDDLLVFLGGDLGPLRSRYELVATAERDGSAKIVATPKADELKKHLKKIAMQTNPERWGIASVAIDDASGDTTTITFGANAKDAKVDAAKMKPS